MIRFKTTELLHRNGDSVIYIDFCVQPVRKTLLWIEKYFTPFRMVSTSSINMQTFGKIALRERSINMHRLENIVFAKI